MAKKKIGIITMHRVWNFGSALQTYAMQYIVESLGYECELIDYVYPNLEHSAYQKTIVQPQDLGIKSILYILASKIKAKIIKPRNNLFEKFYLENYHCSAKRYNTITELLQDSPKYDVYLTGSDQVWNPKYIGFDTNFMLSFAPSNAKKVSYASSFAVSDIPIYLKELYGEKLNEYQNISVRESSGKKLIKELTGKDAEVVCDPTLLLNREQWEILAQKSIFKIDEPYLLVYFLGYAYNPYPEVYSYVERVNKELKLPVIYLNAKPGRLKGKYREFEVSTKGPNEFLYLILHADFIITDSFHGTAFALNFEKRFISCIKDREGTDSRILDLLKIVGAENHAVVYNFRDKIDYGGLSRECLQLLSEYRQKSLKFLQKSI